VSCEKKLSFFLIRSLALISLARDNGITEESNKCLFAPTWGEEEEEEKEKCRSRLEC